MNKPVPFPDLPKIYTTKHRRIGKSYKGKGRPRNSDYVFKSFLEEHQDLLKMVSGRTCFGK